MEIISHIYLQWYKAQADFSFEITQILINKL